MAEVIRKTFLVAAVALIVGQGPASGQPASQPASQPVEMGPATSQAMPTAEDIEKEVYQNVLRQSVEGSTVKDFQLPDVFVRRVSDRAIRDSYEERYRIVVGEAPPPTVPSAAPGSAPFGGMPITVVGLVIVIAVIGVWAVARKGK